MLKKLKSIRVKKQVTFLSLLLALAVAIFLNWQYAKSDGGFRLAEEDAIATELTVLPIQNEDNIAEADLQKNYGDAQLVGLGRESGVAYFEKARLSRSKARDEALDKLQKTLKDAKLTEEEKKVLTDSLSVIIKSTTDESDIENLIKAKGFVDCIAFIDSGKINVAVMTRGEALTKAEVVQIRDIVISKSGIEAKNIKIVEVK